MTVNKNSGQVIIIGPYGSVYLYTHDTANTLVKDVYDALQVGKRWDDPDYLSKMIFCRMLPLECWLEDKGFGIGTQMYNDVNLLISVNTVQQIITIHSMEDKYNKIMLTFQEFIDSYANNASL
jgi:hypothetical protein